MTEKITLMEYFTLGGKFMYPLLIFSVATLALVIDRLIYFLTHNLRMKDIEENVIKKLEENNVNGAVEYLSKCKKNKVGASIILEGLKMYNLGEHQIEKALESETGEKIKELEKGFNFLAALASISPLTGFLGTVSGMISAFRSIAMATEVNAQIVANGIFEALITTVYGLVIAIFALAFYNIYAHIVDSFVSDVEKVGTDMVSTIAIVKSKTKSGE